MLLYLQVIFLKKNIYKIDNSVERLLSGKPTLFLDQKEYQNISGKLNKNSYNIYYPYKDSEKIILYKNILPDVSLIEINSYEKLKHSDILGSIMNLNISSSYLGDIIVDNDNYYFYIISDLKNYILENLTLIGNKKVLLKEIDINYLSDYERKYEELEFIVSSNRVDNVIAKLINTSRDNVSDKIKNREVIVNYEELNKSTYTLKEGDIFSIRRYGKYKFVGVVNTTKKNKIVVKCLKYI